MLVITTETILIIEKTDKKHKIKDHLSFKDVTSLQMTSGMDHFLLIKVSEQLDKSKVRIIVKDFSKTPHIM